MKVRGRVSAVLFLTTLIALGACADDDSPAASSSAADPSPSATASPTAAPGGDRVVAHDKGRTEVPAEPRRIVTLDSPLLDAAIFLGVSPVGAVRTSVDTGLPDYLDDRTEGIEVVGEIGQPNLEAIAALRPDLILSSTLRDDALYDRLSGIAPTVFAQGPGTTWREDFQLVGEALGKADEARAALADFDARAARVGEDLDLAGTSAAIVRFLPDEVRVYGPDSFSGSVLRAIGLSAPELNYDEFAIEYLSPETITQADADIIFTAVYGDPEDTPQDRTTPLWGNLRAVRGNCQFDVDDDTWMVGIGLIGASAILDDVERLLTDGNCGVDD